MRLDGHIRHISAMKPRDATDNCKSKSSPTCFRSSRGVDPVEPLENLLGMPGRNADSMVLDGNPRNLRIALDRHQDLVAPGMAHRIADQVRYRLFNELRIAADNPG